MRFTRIVELLLVREIIEEHEILILKSHALLINLPYSLHQVHPLLLVIE